MSLCHSPVNILERLASKGPPLGNSLRRVEWSRDHNTPRAQYLEHGWTKGPPTGNGLWGIQWSRDRLCNVNPKGQVVTPIRLEPNMLKTTGDAIKQQLLIYTIGLRYDMIEGFNVDSKG